MSTAKADPRFPQTNQAKVRVAGCICRGGTGSPSRVATVASQHQRRSADAPTLPPPARCSPLAHRRPAFAMQACYVWYNEMYKCYSQQGKEADACKAIKKDVRCVRACVSCTTAGSLPAVGNSCRWRCMFGRSV